MDQDNRTATAVVLIVDLDGGTIFGADDYRSHCVSPFLRSRWMRVANLRMTDPAAARAIPGRIAISVTTSGHSRPGRRVVTSCTIHRLSSGSLKEQNDP